MAIIGEIVVFLLGLAIIFVGVFASLVSSAFSGNKELVFIPIPVCIGGYLIYLAIHYGPITISIGG